MPETGELVPVIGGVDAPPIAGGVAKFGPGTCTKGLTPPTPSSVEPMGIPPRPVPVETEPVPVGEDADAAGLPTGVAAVVAQVPDTIAPAPPPSKSELGALKNELAVPLLAFVVGEVVPEQLVLLLLVGTVADDVPEGPGLTAMDPSPAVPSGTPVPETAAGGTGLMPSGEVASGDGAVAPIWAYAEPQRKSAAIAPVNTRAIMTASG